MNGLLDFVFFTLYFGLSLVSSSTRSVIAVQYILFVVIFSQNFFATL
jgi:hypothetical protein